MYISFQGNKYFLLHNCSFENDFCCLKKVKNGKDITSHREAVRKGGRKRCTLQHLVRLSETVCAKNLISVYMGSLDEPLILEK